MELINKNQVIVKIANKTNPKSLDILSERIEFLFCENSEMKQRMINLDKVVIVNEINHVIQI